MFNFTSLLTSPADWSNYSADTWSDSLPASYTRLREMLQFLNGSSPPVNLTQRGLLSEMLNKSHQETPYGLPSLPEISLNEPVQSGDDFSFWIRLLFYFIYAAIGMTGVCGNALVCYAVARNPAMHTVTNLFIFNLSLSDILLSLFAVPITVLYLVAYKSWIFGSTLCHLLPFAQGMSIYISAWTLMAIAIDRYFVIMYPLRTRMKMRSCLIIITFIWLSSSVLTSPYGLYMQLNPVENEDEQIVLYCDENWPQEGIINARVFGGITSTLQFIIPFVIITFCYIKVCGKLWDRTKSIPGNVSARREELERERARRTNTMLIVMSTTFVMTWLPLNIHNLITDFIPTIQWQYQGTVFLFVHAVAMSSSCSNSILYGIYNENFKREFRTLNMPCCSKLFASSTAQLGQQETSKRPSCTNSSKRSVRLHLTEENAKSPMGGKQMRPSTPSQTC